KSVPYVSRVYGVTPWRKQYAEDYFRIPEDKTDVLIMGADDEKINLGQKNEIRKNIRSSYNISDNDFLIVTGGKIDKKKKIDLLMEACAGFDNVKLLVFGNVSDDIKERFDALLESNKNIIYIGWIDADTVYDYFFAADLVFFPGQHSVLWEQACAAKVPCVFERWEGMEHVNNGGNSDFVAPVSITSIKSKISELLYTDKYFSMKGIAESDKTDIYLYSKIAEKSLDGKM
ncbi:MAG: glycosyltransferase, partial [Clostridia bacterium]|nr:glycosyltransferase [Clostridia bacterium]